MALPAAPVAERQPIPPQPAAARWRRWLRPPAVRAALLQCLAHLAMLALVFLLARQGYPVTLTAVALLQGVLAALFTWCARLAVWWRLIGLLFPLALLGASSWHWPPLVFLLGFAVLLGWYWSTFRTQVPFYPSGPLVWSAVAALLPAGRPAHLIDVGSGLGGLVLALARQRPESRFTGIELAPLPWLVSHCRARLARRTHGMAAGAGGAQFLRGDYERLDFARYDAVFAYLSPAAMPALWDKAQREMRSGTMLISYEFEIAAKLPDKTIATTPVGPALYVWYF